MSYIGAKPASGRSGIWLPEAVRRRGGGGSWNNADYAGGAGGSGIVIIRYALEI